MFEELLTTQYESTKELIETFNDRQMTPLMLAAFIGDVHAIALLQTKQAQLEKKNGLGYTAMHWAALGRQKHSIDLLYYYGCSTDTRDLNGKCPDQLIEDSSDLISKSLAAHLKKLSSQSEQVRDLPPLFSTYLPENFVFRGGSVRGLVYQGALQVLEKEKTLTELKRVAGTSAGAINAWCQA